MVKIIVKDNMYANQYNDSTRSYHNGVPVGGRPIGSSTKMEENLIMHVKKALSSEETAPKQKHVRACIVYTWDIKSSGNFWNNIKTFPIFGDEVVAFKALILIHKVIREGYPSVLKDAIREAGYFDQLAKSINFSHSVQGYGNLIRAYSHFILAKLEYHKIHPEFSGTFDYEEYVTLKGIEDPNEGFETINDLLGLLDKLDALQKLIFANFRPSSNNECRIAALVPLVEESNGIYQFLVSMLMAMHQIIGSVEMLGPLREKFNRGHYALLNFYYECSNLQYLTSLITVPKLKQDPPNFLGNGPPTLPARITNGPSDDEVRRKRLEEEEEARRRRREEDEFNRQQDEFERQLIEEQKRIEEDIQRRREIELQEKRRLEDEQRALEDERLKQQEQEQLRLLELQRQQDEHRKQMEEEFRKQQFNSSAQMEAQMLQQRLLATQAELDRYRQQSLLDRGSAGEAERRIHMLEDQLSRLNLGSSDNALKDQTIAQLRAEIAQWKQKYEALAKLYAQLRKEHIDLLKNFKEARASVSKITADAGKEAETVRAELKAKGNELTELLIERDQLKVEVERMRGLHDEEANRIKHELEDAKKSLLDVSQSKGTEMQTLINRFQAEKDSLNNLILSKQAELDAIHRQLDTTLAEYQRNKASQKGDLEILQTALDQTLIATEGQRKAAEAAQREKEFLASQLEQSKNILNDQLFLVMNSVLESCQTSIHEAIFEFDSSNTVGNQTATPEYVLTLLEKAQLVSKSFSQAFVRLLQTNTHKDAILNASSFSQSIIQFLRNAKGIFRLVNDEEQRSRIFLVCRTASEQSIEFLGSLKSERLTLIPESFRPEKVLTLAKEFAVVLDRATNEIETVAAKKLQGLLDDNIEDEVEKQMKQAADAVTAASKRLQELLLAPQKLDVHDAILKAAMALTTAIAVLIQRSTESQHEIVEHGKGITDTTNFQFYKKNNKWTEGLISAAHSVANATTFLVETADGIIVGDKSFEQMVVSAQEVSVATTQLVAASRVKATPFSKTQTKLEEAAVSVRKSTELLVKAATDASKSVNGYTGHSRDQSVQNLSRHQLKVAEMEQKVKILEIENQLESARQRLGDIVKKGYQNIEEVEEN